MLTSLFLPQLLVSVFIGSLLIFRLYALIMALFNFFASRVPFSVNAYIGSREYRAPKTAKP